MTDARLVAEKLLQAQVVILRPEQPFTWASGWKSPIYCDNRKLLSLPYIRDFIKSELANLVFEKYPDADLVAGVATAGIAWGALVADQLKLPFVYVRPKPKEHGRKNQIEGGFSENQRVVVVEDLISTGQSSLLVADVLRAQGLSVEGMVSIFSYGFEQAKSGFRDAGIPMHTLTNYSTLLQLAVERSIINPKSQATLLKWSADPAGWSSSE